MENLNNAQIKEVVNKVDKLHSRCRDKTKVKLYRKVLGLRSKWAKEINENNDIVLAMMLKALGSDCPYCGNLIDIKNISLDHMVPLERGGVSYKNNVEIICTKCNIRKGIMTDKEFAWIMSKIDSMKEEPRDYILQKLSSRGYSSFG